MVETQKVPWLPTVLFGIPIGLSACNYFEFPYREKGHFSAFSGRGTTKNMVSFQSGIPRTHYVSWFNLFKRNGNMKLLAVRICVPQSLIAGP